MKKTTKGNKFIKGLLIGTTSAAMLTSVLSVPLTNIFRGAEAYSTQAGTFTSTAFRIDNIKVPTSVRYGENIKISLGKLTSLNGNTPDDFNVIPTVMENTGRRIDIGSPISTNPFWNDAENVYEIKADIKGNKSYKVFYEYVEERNGKKQTLSRSDDYFIDVTSVAYSVRTETNVRYTSSDTQLGDNGAFYAMPLTSGLRLQAEQSFTLQMPRITDNEGNILFFDKGNYFNTTGYFRYGVAKYVTVRDFAGIVTEEELLNGHLKGQPGVSEVFVPQIGLVDISVNNFPYAGTTNVDDNGLNVSVKNSKGIEIASTNVTELDLKDRHGRPVKTKKITLPNGSTAGDYGNYTIQYTFKDGQGTENDLTKAYSFNVGVNEDSDARLNLSFDGVKPPSTGTKGAEIQLSKVTAKDSLTEKTLDNVYTKVSVTFVKNGVEYNPDTYTGASTSTPITGTDEQRMNKGKDISDDLKFRLTNAANEDGSYYIRYFTFSVNDSNLKSRVFRYTISSITDAVAPEVKLVEDYNQDNFIDEEHNAEQYRVYNAGANTTVTPEKTNQAVVADSTKIVDGTYLLPTKVQTLWPGGKTVSEIVGGNLGHELKDHEDLEAGNTPSEPKKYVGRVYFPAVFASDDVSKLGGIRIERTITLQGTTSRTWDLSALYYTQHKQDTQLNVLAPNRGAYIYLEHEGTYTLTVSVTDEAGNQRTVTDYEFVMGTAGNDTAVPTGLGLSVQQVFEVGEQIKFERPRASHVVDSNVNVETYYFYEGDGYSAQQRAKLDALRVAIESDKNYKAIKDALADCGNLIFKPEKRINDKTYYYINPKSQNLADKDIYVFSFSASYAVRNLDTTSTTGTNCSTSFVTIQNKNKLINADTLSPDSIAISESYDSKYPNQSAWSERTGWFALNPMDVRQPFIINNGVRDPMTPSDPELANSFVNAYQKYLIRLPDLTFTDDDSGFGITAKAYRVNEVEKTNSIDGNYFDTELFGGIKGANVSTTSSTRNIVISDAGTNYQLGDVVKFNVGAINPVEVTAAVASIDAGGEVTAVTVTHINGTSASSIPNNLPTGSYVTMEGNGTGLQIDIVGSTTKQIAGGTYTPSHDGDYIISYTARDGNGNSTVISFAFNVIDTEPPSLTYGSVPTTLELGTTHPFSIPRIMDNGTVMTGLIPGVDYGIEMVGDDNPSDSGFNTTTLVWTPTIPGVYSFRYFAKDATGNEVKGAIFTIEVRKTIAPEINVKVDELNNNLSQHSNIVPLIFDENSLCNVPLEASTGANSYKNIEIPTFIAGDAVSQTVSILYNGVSQIDVLYTLINDYAQDLTDEVSPVIQKVVNNEMYADGTRLFFNPTSGHGIYTIKYQATDEYGNVGTREYKVAVGDTENPTITEFDADFVSEDFAIGDTIRIDRKALKAADSGGDMPNRFSYNYGGYTPKDDSAAEQAKDHTLDVSTVNITVWHNGISSDPLESITSGDEIYSEYTFEKSGSFRIVYRIMDVAGNSTTKEVSFNVKENHDTTDKEGWPTWAKVLLAVGSLGVLGVVLWIVLKNPTKIKSKRKKDLVKTDEPVV